MGSDLSRRNFLRQSFAFSAAGMVGTLPRFASASPLKNAEHYLMIGDWGYERMAAQQAVAEAMQRYVRTTGIRTDALLLLGDNWYGDMTGGVDSPRWQKQFEQMYPQSIFDCKAYAVLGNHDYQRMPESKVNIQLAYAKRGNTRWTMPSRWYSFPLPAKKPLATVIALDSNVQWPGRIHSDNVNFHLSPEEQAEQLRWLEVELAKPRTTPFLFVMAHHPIYSNGPHGDHAILVKEWAPLLEKYKVHLYFAGHDHDMQHLEFDQHPTSHVLSGGGGADLYTLKIEEADRGPSARKVHGFTHMELTSNKVTLKHLDEEGRLIHAFSKTPSGEVTIL